MRLQNAIVFFMQKIQNQSGHSIYYISSTASSYQFFWF